MASLFCKQAGIYATARPRYPAQLYKLLASLSKGHKRAWDVGTGNGQAAVGLAEYYEEIIATDVSAEQLRYAEARPNVRYATTAGPLSQAEVARVVGEPQSLDLITVAQAVHWFHLPSFYSHVQRLLNPGGIIAVWCYSYPKVNPTVDGVLADLCEKSLPFWEPEIELVNQGYQNLQFPFQPALPGQPIIRMDATKDTNLEGYLGFLESWSAVNTARKKGYELMDIPVKQAFQQAWGSPSQIHTITFPLYMRVGSLM